MRILNIAVRCAWLTLFACAPTPANAQTQSQHVLAAAAEIRLTPEAIAASGLRASLATMLDRLAASDIKATISGHRTSLTALTAELTAVNQSLARDAQNATLLQHRAQVVAQIGTTRQAIAASQQALLAAVTNGLPAEALGRLALIRAGLERQVPTEFMAKSRSETEWHALELAIVAEARSQRTGKPPPPEVVALLAQTRAEPEVMAAAERLNTDLAPVKQAFDSLATS